MPVVIWVDSYNKEGCEIGQLNGRTDIKSNSVCAASARLSATLDPENRHGSCLKCLKLSASVATIDHVRWVLVVSYLLGKSAKILYTLENQSERTRFDVFVRVIGVMFARIERSEHTKRPVRLCAFLFAQASMHIG